MQLRARHVHKGISTCAACLSHVSPRTVRGVTRQLKDCSVKLKKLPKSFDKSLHKKVVVNIKRFSTFKIEPSVQEKLVIKIRRVNTFELFNIMEPADLVRSRAVRDYRSRLETVRRPHAKPSSTPDVVSDTVCTQIENLNTQVVTVIDLSDSDSECENDKTKFQSNSKLFQPVENTNFIIDYFDTPLCLEEG